MATEVKIVRVPTAPKKERKHFTRQTTVSLGIILGLAPGVVNVFNTTQKYGINEGMRYATQIYTGYNPADGSFHIAGSASHTRDGLMPLLAGFGLHVAAQKFGINRMIARAGIPFVRI